MNRELQNKFSPATRCPTAPAQGGTRPLLDGITPVRFDLAPKKGDPRPGAPKGCPDALGGAGLGVMPAAEVHYASPPGSVVAR